MHKEYVTPEIKVESLKEEDVFLRSSLEDDGTIPDQSWGD